MRVVSRDRRYSIDVAGVQAFLLAEGFSQAAVDDLIVHLRPDPPARYKEVILGEFKEPRTVYLYTRGLPAAEANNTLFHELRHYWQLVEHRKVYERKLEEYQHKRGRAKERFFLDHIMLGYHAPSEHDTPYEDRQCEQDARAYAALHAPLHCFVTRQQTCRLTLPLALFTPAQDVLTRRAETIGGIVRVGEKQAVIERITRQDAERLALVLRQQTGKTVALRGGA